VKELFPNLGEESKFASHEKDKN